MLQVSGERVPGRLGVVESKLHRSRDDLIGLLLDLIDIVADAFEQVLQHVGAGA